MNATTRRGFIQSAGAGSIAVACAPGASPTAGTSPDSAGKQAWEAEWDKLVAAAKQEGKLVIQTLAGEGYRKLLDTFQQAFPGIDVELTAIASSSWAPKFLSERKAGLYAWDVTQTPPITGFSLFADNVYDPIRPLMFRPDILEDRAWAGGHELGWLDNDKKWVFQTGWDLTGGLFINTDLVPEGEVKTARDMLAPKWKGKIVSFDPRTGGASATPLTVMRLKLGDTSLKQLFVDQEAVISRDMRQLTEFLIRGRYAIGFGTTRPILDELQKEGLGKNVKQILPEDFTYLAGQCIWLINRAPHPNAAKLYVNWFLSKEGQQTFIQTVGENSRRTDVPKANAEVYPPDGADKRFLSLFRQAIWEEVDKTRDLTRDLLK